MNLCSGFCHLLMSVCLSTTSLHHLKAVAIATKCRMLPGLLRWDCSLGCASTAILIIVYKIFYDHYSLVLLGNPDTGRMSGIGSYSVRLFHALCTAFHTQTASTKLHLPPCQVCESQWWAMSKLDRVTSSDYLLSKCKWSHMLFLNTPVFFASCQRFLHPGSRLTCDCSCHNIGQQATNSQNNQCKHWKCCTWNPKMSIHHLGSE